MLSGSQITGKSIAELQLNKWLVHLNFALFYLSSRKKLTELHTYCLNVNIKCIFHDLKWIRSITNWCIGMCFSWFTGSSQSMAPAYEPSLISWTLPNYTVTSVILCVVCNTKSCRNMQCHLLVRLCLNNGRKFSLKSLHLPSFLMQAEWVIGFVVMTK